MEAEIERGQFDLHCDGSDGIRGVRGFGGVPPAKSCHNDRAKAEKRKWLVASLEVIGGLL